MRPRHTARPRFETRYPLKPKQVAVEERWGVTELIADRGWFREVGQLSWREATVYLVGDKTGLVVDPWFLSRRLDLAMPAKAVDAVALLGAPAAESEPVSDVVGTAVPELRLAR